MQTKYRVIDPKTGKVLAYEWLVDNGWMHERTGGQITVAFGGTCPQVGIREQFTGLLDKNGVEIYEGDVLVVDNDINLIYEVQGEKGPVKLVNGAFGLNCSGFKKVLDGECSEYVKVIGHAHDKEVGSE